MPRPAGVVPPRGGPAGRRCTRSASGSTATTLVQIPVAAFLRRAPGRRPDPGRHRASTPRWPSTRSRTSAASARCVFTRPEMTPEQAVPAQLRARGHRRRRTSRMVVMTHLHSDHASAIVGVPRRDLRALAAEWDAPPDGQPSSTATSSASSTTRFDYRTLDFESRRGRLVRHASAARSTCSATAACALVFTPGHTHGHMSVRAAASATARRCSRATRSTRCARSRRARCPYRMADEHHFRRSLREIQRLRASETPGRADHPGPRHGRLAARSSRLRVRYAVSGLGGLARRAARRSAPRCDRARLRPPGLARARRAASRSRRRRPPTAACACSRVGSSTCSKRIGSPYWTVTFGNCSRFQLRTRSRADDRRRARPARPSRAPAGRCPASASPSSPRARAAALGVHDDQVAAAEDRRGRS